MIGLNNSNVQYKFKCEIESGSSKMPLNGRTNESNTGYQRFMDPPTISQNPEISDSFKKNSGNKPYVITILGRNIIRAYTACKRTVWGSESGFVMFPVGASITRLTYGVIDGRI